MQFLWIQRLTTLFLAFERILPPHVRWSWISLREIILAKLVRFVQINLSHILFVWLTSISTLGPWEDFSLLIDSLIIITTCFSTIIAIVRSGLWKGQDYEKANTSTYHQVSFQASVICIFKKLRRYTELWSNLAFFCEETLYKILIKAGLINFEIQNHIKQKLWLFRMLKTDVLKLRKKAVSIQFSR